MKKFFLFDLDGVLADSKQGLYLSFRAAAKSIGIANIDDSKLQEFLGTPLPEMCRILKPSVRNAEIETSIIAFRDTYEREGIKHNELYPGVAILLQEIVARKAQTWIVTSKPQVYAQQVAAQLGINRYFNGVVGAGLDEKDTKSTLIARALLEAKAQPSHALMLGDRQYDITGAIDNNVAPVGALWGYGSREELAAAGCKQFAASPDEFRVKYVES